MRWLAIKLYRFDESAARPIDAYGSQGLLLARIVRSTGPVQIGCMHLRADGAVGYHQATVPQLFLVVHGSGWVQGEGKEPVGIEAGQAAFWAAGEFHGAGTPEGMVALVIEGETIDASIFMPEA